MKKIIIGIVFLIICIGLTTYYELKLNKNYQTNIHDITNSGASTENVKVYLNATYIAGTIKDDYYVVFGDGVQYIVYISNKEANKINRYLLDNEEESYRIEGITKLIPSTMEENGKKFVKEWLDHSHNHEGIEEEHDHSITTDEFYQYFGYVYLDTNNFDVIKLIIYITSIIGILSIIYSINIKYHLL